MSDPRPTLALARQVLENQPFSVLLGARVAEFGESRAVIEIDIRPQLCQHDGFLHGGVLGYAADSALTFAAGTVLGASLLTAGFTIDYLRPAKGAMLRAIADVVNATGSRATTRCDLFTVDERGTASLCAVAQGVVVAPQRGQAGARAS
ncbi:PaaI family thioesterase [Saccharomonospora sp. NPDC006951]